MAWDGPHNRVKYVFKGLSASNPLDESEGVIVHAVCYEDIAFESA
jgi:hypothetical protein